MAAVFILFSCSHSGSEKNTGKKDSLRSEIDTFYVGKKLFTVEPSSKEEFDKLPETLVDTAESHNLLKDSGHVKRTGDSLVFTLNGSGRVVLKNEITDDDSYVRYTYCGSIPEIGKWLVYGAYYEWYNYLLIDQSTGDTTEVIGEPLVSPDRKHFVCANSDLFAGFTYNGIELFENEQGRTKLIGSREIGAWGPDRIRWLDNSTMLVEQSRIDTTAQNMEAIRYIRLKMDQGHGEASF